MTKSEYQARIDKLQCIIDRFHARFETGQNDSFERTTRLLALSLAKARLQWEMFAYATDDVEKMEVGAIRKRTWPQIKESKAIYRKHAARYQSADYPVYRCKRMMAYTAALTKAIAKAGER